MIMYTDDVTDLSAGNIFMYIEDGSLLEKFIKEEQDHPSPRKEINGYSLYISRRFGMPKAFGLPVLGDFGAAVFGDVEHLENVQPDVYRAPEVCLKIPWSYSIDIWNVGVLVLMSFRHIWGSLTSFARHGLC